MTPMSWIIYNSRARSVAHCYSPVWFDV